MPGRGETAPGSAEICIFHLLIICFISPDIGENPPPSDRFRDRQSLPRPQYIVFRSRINTNCSASIFDKQEVFEKNFGSHIQRLCNISNAVPKTASLRGHTLLRA